MLSAIASYSSTSVTHLDYHPIKKCDLKKHICREAIPPSLSLSLSHFFVSNLFHFQSILPCRRSYLVTYQQFITNLSNRAHPQIFDKTDLCDVWVNLNLAHWHTYIHTCTMCACTAVATRTGKKISKQKISYKFSILWIFASRNLKILTWSCIGWPQS